MTTENNNYRMPAVVWLKVTDFMHGWLQKRLGGAARIGDKRIVCVQVMDDRRGVRDVLEMETADDVTGCTGTGWAAGKGKLSMSATRRNCIVAGLDLDEKTVERLYGITRSEMALYLPIECPDVCLTQNGVLRPWTNDVCFGQRQATAMQKLLREAFWKGVEDFDREYAAKQNGSRYAAVDMIEAFCADTGTPDIHVDALRREWQRRVKRKREGVKSEE